MDFLRAILGGLAGDAIFWILDKQFLALSPPYQISGAIIVFLISAGGLWLARERVARGLRLLSGSKFEKSMSTSMERVSIDAKGGGADVLFGNTVSGPAKIEIKDTTIKS